MRRKKGHVFLDFASFRQLAKNNTNLGAIVLYEKLLNKMHEVFIEQQIHIHQYIIIVVANGQFEHANDHWIKYKHSFATYRQRYVHI